MTSEREGSSGSAAPFRQRRRWPLGPVRTTLVATLALSALFLIWPEIDLWFSGLFYDPETGFAAADLPPLQSLRGIAEMAIWLIAVATILSVLVKLALPERPSPIAPGSSLLLISTLITGPGLLVNGILKANWGRPRPTAVEAFGGDAPYVEVWRITDYCDGNCSFVSGEASAAIWLVTLALVVPIAWRNRTAIVALLVAGTLSLNRVAFGGHFLSDVLISWSLTLTVIAVTHHFLFVRSLPGLANESLERGLTTVGRSIRRGISAITRR